MSIVCHDPVAVAKLTRYAAERGELLTTIVQRLQSDQRVVAAWLFGSLGRETADVLSDIDLFVVAADDSVDAMIANRRAMIESVGMPLLVLEAPQNRPPDGAYNMALYPGIDGPHQVDWYWQPATRAAIPAQTQILFDRIGLKQLDTAPHFDYQPVLERDPTEVVSQTVNFFWGMLLIAAKYLARSPREADMGLADYCRIALNEVHRFIGNSPAAMIDRLETPTDPAVKIEMLHGMAANMMGAMHYVEAMGGILPWPVVEPAQRYLDLIDALTRDR